MHLSQLLFTTVLLLCFHLNAVAQDSVASFGSPICVFSGLGYNLNKQPNLVLVDARGVTIEERDTCYHINSYAGENKFVVVGELSNGDTLNQIRYNFNFMITPDPKVHWKAMETFQMGDRNAIGLHRDSLEYLKEFNVWIPNQYLSHLPFEVVQATMYTQGWKGAPISFKNSNMLPDAFIDSLQNFGDTVGISMTTTVRGVDGIARQIGVSTLLIKMDGDAYAYHRDPHYFYKNFSDTIALTKEQLYSDDTLKIHNPGRLFIQIPRLEENYYFNWDNGVGFSIYIPPTFVEAGEGFFLDDLHSINGAYELRLSKDEHPSSIDIETGKYVDPYFIKKPFIFTYPDPLK